MLKSNFDGTGVYSFLLLYGISFATGARKGTKVQLLCVLAVIVMD